MQEHVVMHLIERVEERDENQRRSVGEGRVLGTAATKNRTCGFWTNEPAHPKCCALTPRSRSNGHHPHVERKVSSLLERSTYAVQSRCPVLVLAVDCSRKKLKIAAQHLGRG